jgi:hypothetical protein
MKENIYDDAGKPITEEKNIAELICVIPVMPGRTPIIELNDLTILGSVVKNRKMKTTWKPNGRNTI